MRTAAARPAADHSAKPYLICQPKRAPTFAELDRRRREIGVSVSSMLDAAGVHNSAWWEGRAGKVATRDSTLRRLAVGLDRLAAGRDRMPAPRLIAAAVRACEEIIRQKVRSPALIVACNPNRAPRGGNPRALPARRVRTLAIYVAAVELEIENADLARALGCARQNIKQLRDEVEDLRDDKRVDALLDRIAALLKGTGA